MPSTKPSLSVGTAGMAARGSHGLPQREHSRDRTGRGEQGQGDFRPSPGRAAGNDQNLRMALGGWGTWRAHLPEDDLEVIEVLIRTGAWRVSSGRYGHARGSPRR